MKTASRPSYVPWIISLGLVLLTVLAFLPVFSADFVEFDDDLYVTANPFVRNGVTLDHVRWAFTTLHAAFWHPLTWLSLMLDAQLYDMRPIGFHLTNLLLHVASVLLLFAVLQRTTRAPFKSAFVAALFAVHPLHVESVAWIGERKDVLSTCLWFAALWAYVRYAERPRVRWYLATLSLFVLGMLAKPMLVSFPLVLLLFDLWPLGRLRLAGEPLSRIIRDGGRLALEKVPFFIVSVLAAVLAYVAQLVNRAIPTVESNPFGHRLANAVTNYGIYLFKTLYPDGMCCFYPLRPEVPLVPLIVSAVVILLLTLLALCAARRASYLTAGWLWYAVTLLPVSGVVQVGSHAMADRYTYIPLVGIFIMAAWGLPAALRFSSRARPLRIGLYIATLLPIPILAVLTYRQARTWHDTGTLFRHALEVTGGSAMIHSNYGAILFRQGRHQEAFNHYVEALKLNPSNASAHNNLGVLGMALGQTNAAIQHYNEAIRLDPHHGDAYDNLGGVMYSLGRIDEAGACFQKAHELKPMSSKICSNLAGIRFLQGHNAEAETLYRQALQLDPHSATAHYNLGIVLERTGRPAEAVRHYLQALRRRPRDRDVINNLTAALALVKDPSERRSLEDTLNKIRQETRESWPTPAPPHPEEGDGNDSADD